MDQGKICGIAVGLVGGWLLFGAWEAIALGLQQGHELARVFQPGFLIKLLASIAAFVAALTVLAEVRGSTWFAGVASFAMGVLTIAMIVNGVDKSLWQDEIMALFILTALFLGMLAARSQMSAQDMLEAERVDMARERAGE